MTSFETWSLILTGLYDLLTFALLAVTAYIGVVRLKLPNIALYYEVPPRDTKQWGWRRSNLDLVIENRGPDLRNVTFSSEPDFIGWATICDPSEISRFEPKKTSEYFKHPIPYLHSGQRRAYFWCDAKANENVLAKPLSITVEFDNPVFCWPKRLKRTFSFNLAPQGIFDPVNTKYDEHNIAQELMRVREILESSGSSIEDRDTKTDD